MVAPTCVMRASVRAQAVVNECASLHVQTEKNANGCDADTMTGKREVAVHRVLSTNERVTVGNEGNPARARTAPTSGCSHARPRKTCAARRAGW